MTIVEKSAGHEFSGHSHSGFFQIEDKTLGAARIIGTSPCGHNAYQLRLHASPFNRRRPPKYTVPRLWQTKCKRPGTTPQPVPNIPPNVASALPTPHESIVEASTPPLANVYFPKFTQGSGAKTGGMKEDDALEFTVSTKINRFSPTNPLTNLSRVQLRPGRSCSAMSHVPPPPWGVTQGAEQASFAHNPFSSPAPPLAPPVYGEQFADTLDSRPAPTVLARHPSPGERALLEDWNIGLSPTSNPPAHSSWPPGGVLEHLQHLRDPRDLPAAPYGHSLRVTPEIKAKAPLPSLTRPASKWRKDAPRSPSAEDPRMRMHVEKAQLLDYLGHTRFLPSPLESPTMDK